MDARAEVGADTGLAGEHGLEADERAHEAIDVAVIVIPFPAGVDARLCPADACVVPAGADPATWAPFAVRPSVTAEHPLVVRLEEFLAAQGIEVAGVEFIETVDGRVVPYDVNTNTNYNPDVERESSVSATAALADFLGGALADAA